MKRLRVIALVAAALVAGFFAVRWCGAEPPNRSATKEPAGYDFGGLHELESFVRYLQDSKQTNTLRRFGNYSNARMAAENYADLAVTLRILQNLRDGRTNQAYELLEGKLDSDIIGFVASYRELPQSAPENPGLRLLGSAREYRANYPFRHRYANVDEGVADAFKVLDEK